MTAHIWVVDYRGGETTYHETERGAESRARELEASKKTSRAVVYRMVVEMGESA